MLTKVLTLVLVVLIGLALGIETARYVHVHATGVDASGMVNIHHALGFGLLATSGALLLSLSREWLSRQWTRFSVWFELTLDELFDFNSLNVGDGLGSISGSTCGGVAPRNGRTTSPYRWESSPGGNPMTTASYFGDPRRRESEELAFFAEKCVRQGKYQDAAELYRRAADLETQVVEDLRDAPVRVRSVLAVSAVALWFKCGDIVNTQKYAYKFLSSYDSLIDEDRLELERILQRCWQNGLMQSWPRSRV